MDELKCFRWSFFVFNIIIMLVSGVLLGVSIVLLRERGEFEKQSDTNGKILQMNDKLSSLFQIIVAIAISSLLILGGFIGCCGVNLKRRRIMTCYLLWMSVAMGSIVTGGIIIDVLANQAQHNLNGHFNSYDTIELSREFVNSIRKSYNCCNDRDLTDVQNLLYSIKESRITDTCCLPAKLESCTKFLRHIRQRGTIEQEQVTVPIPILRKAHIPSEDFTNSKPSEFIHTEVCSGMVLKLTNRNSEVIKPYLIALGVVNLIDMLLSVMFCCFISRSEKI